MSSKQKKEKILFQCPSVEAGKEAEPNRNDFVSLTGKPIGEGAFGDVWKVRHKQSGNVFAIKCILKQKIRDCKMQEQLNREIRIMYSLNHPHIIKLYNHFEDDQFCYLILELAPNENLWTFLNRRKTLDEATAAQYIREVALAVEYLHNKDPPIIHRDIKPENILLDENNRAKLCDFGWSNFFNDDRTRKTYCGTLDYLAPEMINKTGHNMKLDVWNLGVLLYELLTGRAPFTASSQRELFEKIKKLRIDWPKGFPAGAKDLVHRLLRVDPEERISIQELLNNRWIKAQAPIRETISQDLQTREKLPIETDNNTGEVGLQPVQDSEYVVVSVPQAKMQYNNLQLQSPKVAGTQQREESKTLTTNVQNQQKLLQDKSSQGAHLQSQLVSKEAEMRSTQRQIEELKDQIASYSAEETLTLQSAPSVNDENTRQLLQQKDNEINDLRNQLGDVQKSLTDQETLFQSKQLELGRVKDLCLTNFKQTVTMKKMVGSAIQSLKTELSNTQGSQLTEVVDLLKSQLEESNELMPTIEKIDQEIQGLQQKNSELNGQTEFRRSETAGANKSANNASTSDLEKKLEELKQQQEEKDKSVQECKDQLQLLNRFWDMDKKKVEDLKNEIRQYETIVQTYSYKFNK